MPTGGRELGSRLPPVPACHAQAAPIIPRASAAASGPPSLLPDRGIEAGGVSTDVVTQGGAQRAEAVSEESTAPRRAGDRALFWFGAAVTLAVTAVFVVLSLARNDGRLAFAFDDAAIHFSLVEKLAFHGTWGVVPGEYVSASSSPGWDLLLVGPARIAPSALGALALLVNLAAAIWIVWILVREQTFLRKDARQPLALVLIALVVIVALLLPTLAMVGMEHTLHTALVLQALVLLRRFFEGRSHRRDTAAYLGLLLLAGVFRFESVFVAVGAAVALLAVSSHRLASPGSPSRRQAVRLGGLSLVAAGAPLVVYGIVNKAFGLTFLPVSIASKAARTVQNRIGPFRTPGGVIAALTTDPLLLFLVLGAAVYLFVAWCGGPRRNFGLALTFVLAAVLHAALSEMGQFDRYQTYLVAMGIFVGLLILGEVIPAYLRTGVIGFLIVAIIALASPKIGMAWDTHTGTSNTYRQRYQMGLFLEQYYRDQPVATGELGYVSYFHDGPVTDLLALGDPEVLDEFQTHGEHLSSEFIERIVRDRGVKVIAVYPDTVLFSVPASWQFGGRWTLDEKNVTAFAPDVDFWAPDEESLGKLVRSLDEFESELPSDVTYTSRDEVAAKLAEQGSTQGE
jgi:hypothetical protein